MKIHRRLVVLLILTFPHLGHAANLYLDVDGGVGGFAGNTGNQTWDTTTSIWSSDNTGASASGVWVDGETANIEAGASALTLQLSGNRTMEGLNVLAASGANVIIESNQLNVGASGITHASQDLTIDSAVRLDASQIWTRSAGTLDVNGNVNTNGNDLTIASGTGTVRLDGQISGTGGIGVGGSSFNNSSLLILSGNNSFDGDFSADAGGGNNMVVQITDGGALGSTVGKTVQGSNTSLRLQGGITVTGETLELNSNGRFGNSALTGAGGNNEWTGQILLKGNSAIRSDSGTFTISGGVDNDTAAGRTLRFAGNSDVSVTSAITQTGGGNVGILFQDIAGTVFFSADHSFQGGINLRDGTLSVDVLNNAGTDGRLGRSANINLGANFGGGGADGRFGTLQVTGSGSTNKNLTFVGDSSTDLNGGALDVTGSHVATFSGSINEGGDAGSTVRMQKTGTGTAILSGAGANSFTGRVSVLDGTLQVDTNLGGAEFFQVNTDGTLSGTGTVNNVTVSTGGTLAPGASPGILNVTGGLTLDDDSTFAVELNGVTAGTLYDQVNLTGGLTLGTSNVNLEVSLGYTPSVSDFFVVVLNDDIDAISNVFTQLNGVNASLTDGSNFNLGNFQFRIDYDGTDLGAFSGGNNLVLTVTGVIPEPSGIGMLGLALLSLFWRRGRR